MHSASSGRVNSGSNTETIFQAVRSFEKGQSKWVPKLVHASRTPWVEYARRANHQMECQDQRRRLASHRTRVTRLAPNGIKAREWVK